jgi:adenylate cyclase
LSLRLVATTGERSLDLLRGRSFTVGRLAQSDLPLRDATVSRRHAELVTDGTAVTVRDLGSTNGTFVNGHRVSEAVAKEGDAVAFGKVAFELHDVPSEPARPAAAGQELLEATIIRQVPVRGPSDLPSRTTGRSTLGTTALRLAGLSLAERQAMQLALLLDIAKELARYARLEQLLEKVADVIFEVMTVDRVGILTLGPDETLQPRISRNRVAGAPTTWAVPRSVVHKAMSERMALLIENAPADVRFEGATIHSHGVQSAMCAPLLSSRGCMGIIYLDNLSLIESFSDEDLDFLSAFAGIVAVAIENSELLERVRREAVVLSNFQRYFAPELAGEIAAHEEEVQLGGAKCRVVVLFSDIRGFTALSERLSPEETASVLNEYFTAMVDIVFQHGGTLDKFMGDALMALWGAPLARPDDADRAMSAALAMQRRLRDLTPQWTARGRPRLEVGIGLSVGEVFAGNIGSARRLEYTVLGDAVNTASRLCAEAGPGEILIAEPIRAALARPPAMAGLPPMQLKGKSQPVPVYRVEWAGSPG